MPISLPRPIAAYFAADQDDGGAIAMCFSENAVVIDEHRTHKGRDAIRKWKTEASAKYSYTATPFEVSEQNAQTVVTARVAGNFPGSPVDLRYAFVLQHDLIARLEITA
ncbi:MULTISPECIES: nuclear transport factor 2 family protein [unclassified Chelatococcus]|uniref:nuclear transport factor 2 family protein n=1 Tax=unclassified Chelatococcus TaxID=2638111 RepID=UPI001BD00A72|nr:MULTISPECIES: nuclear transport factor 2 family protein [unclassified Chelatococcus]MBS7699964.1 nuclear transport factor 2 family protein [Chelatococcus sp. YT9]MBX3558611.1 nuclear transport factor 2 family protein [Chelatococcus sp.]